jgi:hypothetical protein
MIRPYALDQGGRPNHWLLALRRAEANQLPNELEPQIPESICY